MLNKALMNGEEYVKQLKKVKEESVNKQIYYINCELEKELKKVSNGIVSLGPFNILPETKKVYEEAGYKFLNRKSGINETELLIMPKGVDL